ncbi:MAG: YdcF family protein [Ruminococcus sp.]|nr:YdcF family protein [Ruminococcus sp.]
MKRRFRGHIRFLLFVSAFIIISALVTTVYCAREYTFPVYNTYTQMKVTGTEYKAQNDNVELKDVKTVNNIVYATFVPKSVGYDEVRFITKVDNSDFDGDITIKYWAGPFGTIICLNYLINFEGSLYVIVLFLLLAAVFAVDLVYLYIYCAKKALFGYTMVAFGGVGLFIIHYLIANIATIIDSFRLGYQFGLGNYLYYTAQSGDEFSRAVTIPMAVFCILLIISNLWLIRHEGYRIQNLLGVILGILWFAGHVINRLCAVQTYFDELKLFTISSGALSVLLSYFLCMLFATALSAFLASRNTPPMDRDYIIILGCAIRKDGSLTPILKGRVDAAINFAKKQLEENGREVKFVPSGGQGSDEVISEGEAMQRYLTEQSIDEDKILPEMKSVNTFENIKLSKKIIEADAENEYNAAFATTNYHVFRGYILAKKLGLKNARGISSKTKWYFFPNAFLREFVGLIVDKWKLHLLVLVLIILTFTGIVMFLN